MIFLETLKSDSPYTRPRNPAGHGPHLMGPIEQKWGVGVRVLCMCVCILSVFPIHLTHHSNLQDGDRVLVTFAPLVPRTVVRTVYKAPVSPTGGAGPGLLATFPPGPGPRRGHVPRRPPSLLPSEPSLPLSLLGAALVTQGGPETQSGFLNPSWKQPTIQRARGPGNPSPPSTGTN